MPPRLKLPLLSLLLLAGLASGRAELAIGDKLPPSGRPAPTGRIVLVDFWASWCAPCRESFPAYAQLHADYGARGLAIVAISVDESAAAYAAFLKRLAPPFATWRDRDHQLVRQIGVPAMPTCYLLGPDGRVRFVHHGFHGTETDRALRREIETLLAENPSAP